MGQVQKNQFEISGRVTFVGQPEVISEKTTKRILVLETITGTNWKNETNFEYRNSLMKEIDGIKEGDWVTILYQLAGRRHVDKEGKTKFYNTLEGLRCSKD
jgi:hypothetical protein